MPMKLRGITHVIIRTAPDKETAAKTHCWASAMLCFGPGNTDFIGQLNYMQNQKNKQMAWQLPIVQVIQDGKPTPLQVFEGCLGTEIAQWASRAMDRVKQDLGQPKLDKIYRVNVNGAEDITQAVKAEEKEAAAS